jgi:hypothetical protein
VKRPAGMPGQPLAHLRMLVGRIVVDDGVDHFSDWDLLLDRVEEADKLLMAMALHVAADDGAVKDVEGCEQRGGAVTFVVVRHRPGTARLHRQTRLGAVERLDLALLVDREDDRMGGRIDLEADDVFEFLGELRVVRQLERADAMRRELVGLKDTLHRTQAHPCGPSLASGRSSGLLRPAAARAPGRPLPARCRSAAVACRACAFCRAKALRRPPP